MRQYKVADDEKKQKWLKWKKYTWPKIKVMWSFPNVKILVGLIVASAICLAVAYILDKNNSKFWEGICSNIFAGLVTGLVLTTASGIKQGYKAKLLCKKRWLEQIKNDYMEYKEMLYKWKKEDDIEDYREYIYEMLAIVRNIYSHIIQSQFDPNLVFDGYKYIKDTYKFDVENEQSFTDELKQFLCEDKNIEGKSLFTLLKEQNSHLKCLISELNSDLRNIEMLLAHVEKTII